MSEKFSDCVTITESSPAMRVAIVAVEGEVRGIRALYACLQRPGMERLILGVQPVRKGEMTMSEMLMDCPTITDHTLANRPIILLLEDDEHCMNSCRDRAMKSLASEPWRRLSSL
jgi:hypothetical protein